MRVTLPSPEEIARAYRAGAPIRVNVCDDAGELCTGLDEWAAHDARTRSDWWVAYRATCEREGRLRATLAHLRRYQPAGVSLHDVEDAYDGFAVGWDEPGAPCPFESAAMRAGWERGRESIGILAHWAFNAGLVSQTRPTGGPNGCAE